LPKLIKLYQDYDDLRDRFEIVAFHDNSVKSIAEAYEQLKSVPVIKETWGVDELPFPVLLDDTPSTIEGWGLRAFPTTVLIDPDGKLMKGRAEGLLEDKLAHLRAERQAGK
jgi:hypothetical protein